MTLNELQEKYDALFFRGGPLKSRDLPIPGAGEPDIIRGIDYLRVLCGGGEWKIGKNLVVIGGGQCGL